MRRLETRALVFAVVSVVSTGMIMAITSFHNMSSIATGQEEPRARRLDQIPSLRPIDAAPDEPTAEKFALRQQKNRRHNRGGSAFDLSKQVEGEASGLVLESEPPPPFPVSTSDLVIVGKITKRQPFLSENRTAIYTEFNVRPEEILKNNPASPIATSDTVVADRAGGAIRRADGRVLRYIVSGVGTMPELGNRYVLFLKKTLELDYEIVCGYELVDGKVVSLEDIADRMPYVNLTEASFLDLIKDIIAKNDRSLGGPRK